MPRFPDGMFSPQGNAENNAHLPSNVRSSFMEGSPRSTANNSFRSIPDRNSIPLDEQRREVIRKDARHLDGSPQFTAGRTTASREDEGRFASSPSASRSSMDERELDGGHRKKSFVDLSLTHSLKLAKLAQETDVSKSLDEIGQANLSRNEVDEENESGNELLGPVSGRVEDFRGGSVTYSPKY